MIEQQNARRIVDKIADLETENKMLTKQLDDLTDAVRKRNEVDRCAAFVAGNVEGSTVRELIGGVLQVFGFDGLYYGNECGCEIDDLAPCCECFGDCKPGHKIDCDPETCAADGDCPWHIGQREVTP